MVAEVESLPQPLGKEEPRAEVGEKASSGLKNKVQLPQTGIRLRNHIDGRTFLRGSLSTFIFFSFFVEILLGLVFVLICAFYGSFLGGKNNKN
jgi:hypothetical protein